MATQTYSSKDVIIVFAGQQLKGVADGDFLSVTPSADLATKSVGGDSNVQRSISADRSGTATITLQQTSPSNAVMQAFANTQVAAPFLVQDLRGTSLISAEKAWVAKQAEAAFGMEAGTREWAIDLGEINWALGGNI